MVSSRVYTMVHAGHLFWRDTEFNQLPLNEIRNGDDMSHRRRHNPCAQLEQLFLPAGCFQHARVSFVIDDLAHAMEPSHPGQRTEVVKERNVHGRDMVLTDDSA